MSRDQQVEERCDEDPGKPDRTRVNEFPTKNHGSFWRKLSLMIKRRKPQWRLKVSHMPDTLSHPGPGTTDPLKKTSDQPNCLEEVQKPTNYIELLNLWQSESYVGVKSAEELQYWGQTISNHRCINRICFLGGLLGFIAGYINNRSF